VRVLLFHPEWSRSCVDCATWLYDDSGAVTKRCGVPNRRPKGAATPCHKCPKIPDGEVAVRENAIELSEKNMQAYRHYLECRAVGEFPDDPIVRRNARILRQIHDEAEQRPLYNLMAMLRMGNGR
jgi:hypothetical protein